MPQGLHGLVYDLVFSEYRPTTVSAMNPALLGRTVLVPALALGIDARANVKYRGHIDDYDRSTPGNYLIDFDVFETYVSLPFVDFVHYLVDYHDLDQSDEEYLELESESDSDDEEPEPALQHSSGRARKRTRRTGHGRNNVKEPKWAETYK